MAPAGALVGSITTTVKQLQDPADNPAGGAGTPVVDYEALLCPICQELYKDPVVTVDGHSYCRKCITEWFSIYDRQRRQPRQALGDESILPLLSPATQLPLACRAVLQNVALSASVKAFTQMRESWTSCDRERCHLSKRVVSLEDEIWRLRRQASEREKLVTQSLSNLIAKDFASAEVDHACGGAVASLVKEAIQDAARPLRQHARHAAEPDSGLPGRIVEAPSAHLEQLCATLRRQGGQLREVARHRGEELQSAVAECERVRAASQQHEAERGRSERQLGSLRDRIVQQTSELSASRQEVESLEAELRCRADRVLESEADAAELELRAEKRALGLEQELWACQEGARTLRAQAERRLQRHRHEFEEFEANLASKDAELRSSAARLLEERAEVLQRTEELQGMYDQLESRTASGVMADSELRATRLECAQLCATAELSAAAIAEKDQALQRHTAELLRLRDELTPSREEARQASSECSERGAELAELQCMLREAGRQLQEAGAERCTASAELQVFKRRESEQQAELQEARAACAELQLQRHEAGKQLQEAGAERSAAGTELQALRRQAAELQAELQAAHGESSTASTELRAQRREAELRGAELQEAGRGLAVVESRLELFREEAAQREVVLRELRAHSVAVSSEMEQLRREARRSEADLRQAREELAEMQTSGPSEGAASGPCSADERDDALRAVCHAGLLEAVRPLIAAGANVNRADPDGVTPLLIASISGHAQIVHELLISHANVNAQDVQGWTPLYVASLTGHSGVVQALLSARADQQLTARDGSSPLDAARECGAHNLKNFLQS